MKKAFTFVFVSIFLFSVFSPSFAQNISTSGTVNSTKQQLITLLTKLLTQLESQLQNLLKTSSKTVPVQASISVPTQTNNSVMSGTLSAESVFEAVKSTDLIISSISQFNVASGDILTIKGHGFLAQNTFHIGSYTSNVTSQNQTISLKVPSLSSGTYAIWVENTNGSSQNLSPQYIKISDQSLSRPVITKSYPQSVSQKNIITVEGTGFDQYNNTINSTLGTLHNVSLINGKLQFKVSDFSQAKSISDSSFPDGMLVTYSVSTSKGLTSNFGFFTFSSAVAKNDQGIFSKFILALDSLVKPLPAYAFGRFFDGGPGDTQGIDTECTCSGSTLLKYKSALDVVSMTHYYVDMPGLSTLVGPPAAGIGNLKASDDYLATIYPYGECLIIEGEDCNTSDNTPEGTINIAGADLMSSSASV